MNKKIWSLIIIIFMALFSLSICYAGKLSSYPFTAVLQNGDFVPVVVVASETNQNINWTSLKALIGSQITGINWQANTLIAQSSAGVNWQAIDPNTGGINWYKLSDGASALDIMCWKSNGQPGKCTTGLTGVNCTSCT